MAANSPKGGGIQWIPWGELTGGQKAARSLLIVVIAVVFIGLIRAALNAVGPMLKSASPVDEGQAALSEQDRKDGIVSLCKVFQIYGMPKNEADARTAARNAADLFKLAGSRTADRSLYIFDNLALEFSNKRLTAQDCATAGEPLEASSTAPPLERP